MSKKQQAYALRVYADTDAGPLIIDVPAGRLTTEYVDQAREAGGQRIRIHALDIDGQTIDRVVVR
jgi:hypothetical protein